MSSMLDKTSVFGDNGEAGRRCNAVLPLTNQRKDRFMAKANLTAERLRELLHYDPETGVFTWRTVNTHRVKVGDVAGTPNSHGYVAIQIGYRIFRAHRLAWLYVHGEWPKKHIDHINGRRDDNRIANLRDVSSEVNLQNLRAPTAANTSGYLGVSRKRDRWRACLSIGDKYRHIGTFDTAEEAYAAYLNAKRSLHEGCTI